MKKKIVYLLIFDLIVVIINASLILYDNFFAYHFKMIGANPYIVNYGEEYVDPGIDLEVAGKHVNDYKVYNNVNTHSIGNYKVQYRYGKNIKERNVEVKDIKGPEIQLEKGAVIVEYKGKYTEPGYKAFDNYDGDVTNKVKVENDIDTNVLGQYSVLYTVEDSSLNKTVEQRSVFVVDTEKPVIKINKNKHKFVFSDKKIKFDDYKATDNYDGDITDKVVVESNINYKKEGKYTVKYKVSDSSKNEQVVERTVDLRRRNTTGIPVLMYHWFYDDTKGEKAGPVNTHNYIAKTQLEKQLKYLKDANFYFLSWEELENYIDGKIDLPQKSIIITDDDCKRDFFSIALPLFQKYKIPVTSFCITSKNTYQKFIKEKYLDLESHTDSLHKRICNTPKNGAVNCTKYEDIYDDIKLSIKKLGSNYAFAYPFGHYNDKTIKALKANHIRLAFTTVEGRVKKGANKYLLPRVRISNGTDLKTYKKLVN